MKRLFSAFFIFSAMAFSVKAKAINCTIPYIIISGDDNDSAEIIQIEERISELQNMNFQAMSPSQKRLLRDEVKQMIKGAENYDRHPYLIDGIVSGTVIIVILLALYVMLK